MKSFVSTSLLLLQCQLSRSFSPVKHSLRSTSLFDGSDAIDVEFTKSDADGPDERIQPSSSPQQESSGSTLQASLNLIEPHLRIPIEFTDAIAQTFIPCNLAFVLEHEGVEYSIGTPVHTQVAVMCEDNNGASYFVDPDSDDNLELMEMAAAKFESLNKFELVFQRTPRTLTVQGDLDKMTAGWKVQENAPKPTDVTNMDESEEDEFFDSFFEKELGSNYREKYLVEDAEMDKKVEDMMDAFNVPGLGTEKENVDGIKDLFNEIEKDLEIAKQDPSTWEVDEGEDEVALRLVGFEGPDGIPYSLVKLLQPMILIAKNHEDLAPDQRFLLSKEESDNIVPVLEKEFQGELAKAGFMIPKYQESAGVDVDPGTFE